MNIGEGRTSNQIMKMKGGWSMIRKMINRMHRAQRGITGLETAIILIAFVVVASVFAYTVLSAGLFSTQESQEAINAGLDEAQSTLVIKGGVIATNDDGGNPAYVDNITFTLTNALKGEAIDFTPPNDSTDGLANASAVHSTIITYTDQYQKVDNLYWTIERLAGADSDNLLEEGEQFQITIGGTNELIADDLETSLTPNLGANTNFSLQLTPASGAVLIIERTIPAVVDDVMQLN